MTKRDSFRSCRPFNERERDIFNAGVDAFQDGQSAADNPYMDWNTDAHPAHLWLAGWLDAMCTRLAHPRNKPKRAVAEPEKTGGRRLELD